MSFAQLLRPAVALAAFPLLGACLDAGTVHAKAPSNKLITMNEESRKFLSELVKPHMDFPKKGVLFQDVFPLFRNPKAVTVLSSSVSAFIKAEFGQVDAIVGLDSRGFLFGPMVAVELGCAFVPVRKQGKLPPPTISASFEKEYGADVFELAEGSIPRGARVVIVDDLLATGGTMQASVKLLESAGATVVACIDVIEIESLGGTDRVTAPCYTVMIK